MTTITPATTPVVAPLRDVEDVQADEPEGGSDSRIEIQHDDVDGVVITLHGVLRCQGVAVLSRRLHAELARSPATVVVDLRRLRAVDVPVREVLAVARERAAASGATLRLVELGHQIGRDR